MPNLQDLFRIVRHVNQTLRSGLSFVYLLGDIAITAAGGAFSSVCVCVDVPKVPRWILSLEAGVRGGYSYPTP